MMSDEEEDDELYEYVPPALPPIEIDAPGKRVDLPLYIIKELERMWYDGKKRLSFFGGHPVSITKLSCN